MIQQSDLQLRFPNNEIFKVGVIATGGGILFGYDLGIISGALIQLKVFFSLTCLQIELVVASALFGALLGSLVGGFIIDCIGRRLSYLMSSVIFLISAIILICTPSYSVLILGRFLVGFGVALASASECIYVSELSPTNIRGSLVSLNEVGIATGFLVAYAANASFSVLKENGWRYMFGLPSLFSIITIITAARLPESPRFLIMSRRFIQARKALTKIRRSETDAEKSAVEQEFLAMNFIDDEVTAPNTTCGRFKQFLTPSLIVGSGLVFFQQAIGAPNIMFYASTIFQSLGFGDETSADLGAVGLGVVKVFTTIFCLLIIDKYRRKSFLLVGTITILISLFTLSFISSYFTFIPSDVCKDNFTSVNISSVNTTSVHHLTYPVGLKMASLISLMVFVSAYAFSFGPLTWIVLSEIFSARYRGRYFSVVIATNWIWNLTISSTFLSFVKSTNGLTVPLVMYGSIAIFATFFILYFIPETKGKTLEEIDALMTTWRGNFNPELLSCCQKEPDSLSLPLMS